MAFFSGVLPIGIILDMVLWPRECRHTKTPADGAILAQNIYQSWIKEQHNEYKQWQWLQKKKVFAKKTKKKNQMFTKKQ